MSWLRRTFDRRSRNVAATPLHAHSEGGSVRRLGSRDLYGVTMFWGLVITATLLILLLFSWPAADRIARHEHALQDATDRLAELELESDALQDQFASLDDPFSIEKRLRRDYNWRAKPD